jgi:hypothetical protein
VKGGHASQIVLVPLCGRAKMSELPTMVALGDDYPELREAVHKICERYPGAYWRKLEAEQA